MSGRSPDEEHRAATPLELFYDLVFVVAIAFAASALHHGIAEDHISESIVNYCLVFFAVWWAWINFTWFASAYDTDDIPYRLAVFVQMIGVLVVAAGIPRAFNDRDFVVVALGYVIMRLALVSLWLRAACSDPEHRAAALRYATGIFVLQIAWILFVLGPNSFFLVGFLVLVIAELAVPAWAERAASSPWHPEHIAERYGLLTIIVLGESILAASIAIQSAVDVGDYLEHVELIVGGLLIVFSLWWLYFQRPSHDLLTSFRRGFYWGYGHYVIWAAAAATGAGLAVAVDQATDHTEISDFVAASSITIPVAIFVLGVWVLHDLSRTSRAIALLLSPVAALLILLSALTGNAVLLTGLILVGLLALKLTKEQAS